MVGQATLRDEEDGSQDDRKCEVQMVTHIELCGLDAMSLNRKTNLLKWKFS
ncbi:MAG: hypothetical protein ACI9UU_000451 [Candidatus Azotimanducaceae bacterium]|jgi:hypothetical protein